MANVNVNVNASGNVLIVEDNVKLLDANRRQLEEEGCRVFIAQTIARAREILENNRIDAVVLDIALPDGNGFEDLFPEIKEKYGIPVLFLTARAAQRNVNAALEAGGFDYVKKPYNSKEFRLRTMRMLGISRDGQLRAFTLDNRLTSGEMKMSRLVARGLLIKQIADEVKLSESRVKSCLTIIYRKLNIEGKDGEKRVILADTLRENGLI